MFEALIITLREGVEGVLVLSIALAVLRRQGQESLRWALFAGAGTAIAASAGLAALSTRLTYNEELAEGIAMLIGAALVLSLVFWMWRHAPHMKEEVESGVQRAVRGGGALALFVFAFGLVLREGVETALFLSAASFTSDGVSLWLGAGLGLLLAAGFGVLFLRGTVRIPLRIFFSMTSAVLLLIAIQLVIGGLHELSEAEVLPASRREMAIIGPLVKNELLLFLLTVAVAFGALLRATPTPAGEPAGASGPAARLALAARRSEQARRRWTALVGLVVVGLLSIAFVRSSRTPARAPATVLTAVDGVVRVEAGALADGRMHFYEVAAGGTPVRFFVVQAGERVQACFDACEICGDAGYFEEGSSVVCRNCTSPIARATLGRQGGCNPIPLAHRAVAGPAGTTLEFREADFTAVLPFLQGR